LNNSLEPLTLRPRQLVTEPSNSIALGGGHYLRRVANAWAVKSPRPDEVVGLEYATAYIRDHFADRIPKPLVISAYRKVGRSMCIAAAADYLKAELRVYAPAGRDDVALARSVIAGPDPNVPEPNGPTLIVIIGVDSLLGQRAQIQGFWELLEAASPDECRSFFGLSPHATPYFILCAGPQPPPINRERIGVLDLLGYTTTEKQRILSVLAAGAGLSIPLSEQHTFLNSYSRDEPGLQAIVRLLELAQAGAASEATMSLVRHHFGPARPALFDQYRNVMPGVCFSAVSTPSGGAELIVEAARSEIPGLRVLGSAGPVMVESAHIGLTAVNALLPSGQRLCTPDTGGVVVNFQGCAHWKKEGSSAGLPVALSLMSLVTGRQLPERFAASGEVTLTGRVLGVAKVPDKVLAWERNGITRSILPRANQEDLRVVSAQLSATHQVNFVGTLAEAFSWCGLLAVRDENSPSR
jgi:hypothetical protein